MEILLHICCGVCASAAAEKLMEEGYKVTGYFYNPCIHPVDEYRLRKEAAGKVAHELRFEMEEGPYDRERWFEEIRGLENESENGRRCDLCYRMRLENTYRLFRSKGTFSYFTTTLTISPHKDPHRITAAGREAGGDRFLPFNFRKKGGFQRASLLAKEWGLHRQDYCGCIYSKEQSLSRKARGKALSDE